MGPVQRQLSERRVWLKEAGQSGEKRQEELGTAEAQTKPRTQVSLQRPAAQPPSWTHVAKGVAMEAVPPVCTPTADPMALGCPSPSPGVSPPAWL